MAAFHSLILTKFPKDVGSSPVSSLSCTEKVSSITQIVLKSSKQRMVMQQVKQLLSEPSDILDCIGSRMIMWKARVHRNAVFKNQLNSPSLVRFPILASTVDVNPLFCMIRCSRKSGREFWHSSENKRV